MEDALAFAFDQPLGIFAFIAVLVSIARGWLVPGPIFNREVERGNALSETNRIQAETINEQADSLRKLADGQELTLTVVRNLDERIRREGQSP